MPRCFALFNILALNGLLMCAGAANTVAADLHGGDLAASPRPVSRLPSPLAAPSPRGPQDMSAPTQILAGPPASMIPALSNNVRRVSQVAGEYGDRLYLVVDKVEGTIALFENGTATFVASALTGQNPADFMPADAMHKTYAQQVGVKYKVTPAGRYTVSVGFDPKYGELLDINEVQGDDWAVAIHQVALRNPQRRDLRLRSANGEDKHITDGCVDVDLTTIRQLIRMMGRREGVPIYILPMDEALFPKLFPSRVTASNRPPRDS